MVRKKKSIRPGLYIIPILALLNFLIVYLINLRAISIEGIGYTLWNNGSLIIQIILMLAAAAVLVSEKTESAKMPRVKPKVRMKRREVVGDIEEEDVLVVEPEYIEAGEPKIIDYPKDVDEGGVYSITMLPISDNEILRLRELLVKPCMYCEEQDSCWEEFRGRVRFKTFRYNVDCKEGLGV